MVKDKYIVFKTSGGLNHMLNQINNAVHISILTKRKLIIDCWGGTFQNDFNKYFNIPEIEYTTNYDCLYQDNSGISENFETYVEVDAKYTKNGYVLHDKKITYHVNNVLGMRDKIIYVATLNGVEGNIPWYIRVNKDVVNKISIDEIDGKYVGIHYRNTDMKTDLNKIIYELHKYDYDEASKIIYFATDDCSAKSRLAELLKNDIIVIQNTYPYDNKGKSIHYSNPNKDEVIMNALIDMFYLMRATYFIPSIKSSFSRRVSQIRIEDKFFEYGV